MSWQYSCGDAGISLFTACLNAGAPMLFTDGMRVLEVGCNESDWLERAGKTWPSCEFIGIDTRANEKQGGNVTRLRMDARSDASFLPQFDAIVSLSAIEHIGLGHYGDPKDPDGDTKALANCWRWLKPGGWLYFDVPYDPTGYRVLNTECRIYDDKAVWDRLWRCPLEQAKASAQWRYTGYVDSKTPGTLIEKPTVAAQRYYYAAFCWQKVH